jgi:hypothetical protein
VEVVQGASHIIVKALQNRGFMGVKGRDPFPPFGVGLGKDNTVKIALVEPEPEQKRESLIAANIAHVQEWARGGAIDTSGIFFFIEPPADGQGKALKGVFAYGLVEHRSGVARLNTLRFRQRPINQWDPELFDFSDPKDRLVFV